MRDDQIRDLAETTLISFNEAELAVWLHASGHHVVCHKGRYWRSSLFGFYRPLHLLARLTAEEATKPTRFCWGFITPLAQKDMAVANTFMLVNTLPNLSDYNVSSLNPKRRYSLRRCHKQVRIISLTSPDPLEQQGYDIYASSQERTGYGKALSGRDYTKSVRSYFYCDKVVVLAGIINGRIGGYLIGYAVDEVAYLDSLVLDSRALKTDIGTGLTFEFVQVCRRSSQIRELVHGTPSQDQSLTFYKERMGFKPKQVAAFAYRSPTVDRLIRWLKPVRSAINKRR